MRQNKIPLADALIDNTSNEYIPFDVPGHKSNVHELINYFVILGSSINAQIN